jgi:hypothetical protein
MKKRMLIFAVVAATSAGLLHAEFVSLNEFTANDHVTDPVSWGDPDAAVPGTVYVSRFGYWQDQPVKMAYWTALPHNTVPLIFQISDVSGKIVYTGHPQWMPDPTSVMVPIGFFYPGLKIYALNFSGFSKAGNYYIELPGYRNSPIFRIRGYLPGMIRNMPGLLTFEQRAGMTEENQETAP